MEQASTNNNDRLIELSLGPLNYDGKANANFTVSSQKISSLKEIFTSHNYSPITWSYGKRKKKNFIKASAFCLDFDKGMTIEEAEKILNANDLNYALVTTRSHRTEAHRFRVLVPFARYVVNVAQYLSTAHGIDHLFGDKCDKAVFDAARFYFASPKDAYYSECWDGKDFEPVEEKPEDSANLDWDDNLKVITADNKEMLAVNIKEKTSIHCPFHKDDNPSAFIDYNNDSDNWFIYCSSCNKTFWKKKKTAPIADRAAKFYSHSTGIYEAGIAGDTFYFKNIGDEKFYSLIGATSRTDEVNAFNWLVRHHHISNLNRIDFTGKADINQPSFEVNSEEGVIDVMFPPVPVEIEDNEFIENYLEETFGEYKQFMKEYMAVYTYTNYQKLPTIILVGDRGFGKNTVADMFADIYKPLSIYWKPEEGNFNPELQKKLLIADETVSRDVKNYTYLKRLSGQAYQTINEKYSPKYQVKNNINVIILSNRKLPIFAEREELPKDLANNQFFVYEMKKFSGPIDAELSDKIRTRLGHYVRTELLDVFNKLDMSNKRYSINVPITDAERRLFNSSISVEEALTDKFIEYLISHYADNPNWEYREFISSGDVPLNGICRYMSLDTADRNKIQRNLSERKLITGDTSYKIMKNNKREPCYEMTLKLKEMIESEVGSVCIVLNRTEERTLKAA